MNKKIFFGMFAAAGMLLATSCSSDELEKMGPGNEAQVTFALNVENGVQTKAISDGSDAKKLVYAVFDEDGKRISTIQAVEKTNVTFPTTESITLAKGQTYQVAFWAQDTDCKAYTVDTDNMNVAVSYDNATNNDETRDAFFKTETFTVTGSTSIDVTLKRPFAQINVGVTEEDWKAAVASGVEIAKSSVVIKNAANSLNLLTGKVTGSTEVSYSLATIPAKFTTPEDLKVDTDGKDGQETYKWLSMSYILVNDESATGANKVNLDALSFTFNPTQGQNIVFDQGLTNVPVQRNWRTNILGQLLTGKITFNITIDPIYEGEYNIEDGTTTTNEIVPGVVLEGSTYKLLSIDGLKWFRDVVNGTAKAPTTKAAETDYYKQSNFAGKTVVLANDIDLSSEKTWTPISSGCTVGGDGLKPTFSGTFDGGNHTISNMNVSVTGAGVEHGAGLFANAVGTIKNVKLVNPTVSGNHYAGAVVGYIYGRVENCHVEGGKIESNVSQNDNGDKAGGIVGYVGEGSSIVENCSVINTTVQAYRDVAGLIGCAQEGTTVSGNRVDNVTVIANQLVNYGEEKDANAGQMIGRKVGTVTETGNSVNNVPVNELKKTISTAEDLAAIATYVNDGNSLKGVTLTLANDIDLQNKPWTPIGKSKNPFSGTFDGANHTISNLNLDMAGKSDVGLFGCTTEGIIKNLTVKNATVKGYLQVAVVAGTPYTSKYENITVTGLVKVDGFSYVGAVGGRNAYANWTNITVNVSEGSYVKANSVNGTTAYRTYVGGVIGFRGEGNHTMTNITSNINVEGSTCDVGGIAGIAHYGNSFINCSSSGNVTISAVSDANDAKEIGGIAGVWHPGGANVTFTNCKYTGQLSVNLENVDLTKFKIVGAAYSTTGAGKLNIDGTEHTAAEWNQ